MAEDERRTNTSGSADAGWALTIAGREAAEDYLREQTRLAREQAELARLQAEELRREDTLRHWSLRVHHVSDVMKVTFEIAIALIALGIVIAIGAAVWSAVHDDGLVIEAFSVPPDLANRGITGQAVASHLLDKLTAMQNATESARPAASYANNWGGDIKVEIPNTGVSIGEMYRYLAAWLGHQTHITGEVVRTANGISVTARAGDDGAGTVSGAESDLDDLLQQAAEKIYLQTQPYRYAAFLTGSPSLSRIARGRAVMEALASQGSPVDRIWAHIGLGAIEENAGDLRTAIAERRQSALLAPDLALSYVDMDFDDAALGHDEAALDDQRIALLMLRHNDPATMSERSRLAWLPLEQVDYAVSLNDFDTALAGSRSILGMPDFYGIVEASREAIVQELALLHDGRASREARENLPPAADVATRFNRDASELAASYWLGEWRPLLSSEKTVEKDFASYAAVAGFTPANAKGEYAAEVSPYVATALAKTGDFKGAHALIDKTPLDCDICLRNRAIIDAAERNWSGAQYWFARVAADAPSIPMSYVAWGQMLMEKGDLDGAIAKFTAANQRGPHFADPVEMWGEVLIRENRSDLALAKFAEAAKYAPNWGRLHLKWGEALSWTGDKAGAARQFALTATLSLTDAEKSEMSRVTPHV